MDYNKTIIANSERLKLSVTEMAFATLVQNGWTAVDANIVLGIAPKTASMTLLRKTNKDITDKEGYNKYIEELASNGCSHDNQDEKEEEKPKARKGKLRDKDTVLDAIEKEIKKIDSPIDRIKALKEIAELQQMKKENTKEKEKLVHFFLPITCSYCALYQQAQKQR